MIKATTITLCILISVGGFENCTNSKRVTVQELLAQPDKRLGLEVEVEGIVDDGIGVPFNSSGFFKLYDNGRTIWIVLPQTISIPPEGIKVRVSGIFRKNKFIFVGNVFYIDAKDFYTP